MDMLLLHKRPDGISVTVSAKNLPFEGDALQKHVESKVPSEDKIIGWFQRSSMPDMTFIDAWVDYSQKDGPTIDMQKAKDFTLSQLGNVVGRIKKQMQDMENAGKTISDADYSLVAGQLKSVQSAQAVVKNSAVSKVMNASILANFKSILQGAQAL